MTEYRIVATLDTEHIYNGANYHYESSNCWYHGRSHKLQTFDRSRAEEYLKIALENCPKFDKETQTAADRNAMRFYQSNIRIQTREVTEWS